MKASIKFREDRKPLLRTKVPISIFGLPFLSGVAAGHDAHELRLDLSTAFDAGPSLRFSYRPKDSWNPFSLVLKTGVGHFGSPADGSPFAMIAEFSLGRGSSSASVPYFTLLFKPRFGDFGIKRTVRSSSASSSAAAAPQPLAKIAPMGDADGDGPVETPIVEFRPENGLCSGKKLNRGFPGDSTAFAAIGGGGSFNGLLSGFEVSASSVLPLRSRAAVKFKWGVRVPAELRSSFEGQSTGMSFSKLPVLVMSKVSIERVPQDWKANEKKAEAASTAEIAEACESVKRQLEALHAENGMLRRAVEELRADVGGRKAVPGSALGGELGRGGAKQQPTAVAKRDRWNESKSAEHPDKAQPAAAENLNEGLKRL